jgi:hypothetical protein
MGLPAQVNKKPGHACSQLNDDVLAATVLIWRLTAMM